MTPLGSDKQGQTSTSISESFQQLSQDFAELFQIKDPLRRDYELIAKAKLFSQRFELSIADYQSLFKRYREERQFPVWLDPVQKLARQFLVFLQGAALFTVIFSSIQFMLDLQDRQVAHVAENWQTIIHSGDQGLRAGAGRRRAIEYLHDRGEDLTNLGAAGAVLSGLNLPGRAQLQEANFRGAKLVRAYLKGANLYAADFSPSNLTQPAIATQLGWSNLRATDLRYADFRGADLQHSCLKDANLGGAIFDANTNLKGTNFKNVQFEDEDTHTKAKMLIGNTEVSLQEWLSQNQHNIQMQDATRSFDACQQISPRRRWLNWLNF
ncbi:pentapeptide repeat-containing protein [Trichothermofontia sp.]